MSETQTPAPCGSRKAGSKRKGQYFNQPYFSTTQKNSKQKIHWSRHPDQLNLDRALLTIFGLEFRKVPGTDFHQLGEIGGRNGR